MLSYGVDAVTFVDKVNAVSFEYHIYLCSFVIEINIFVNTFMVETTHKRFYFCTNVSAVLNLPKAKNLSSENINNIYDFFKLATYM